MSSSELQAGKVVSSGGKLAQGQLGVWSIVFFVMSAAAPLTVFVSGTPSTFRLGGIGAPGAMLACGVTLLLFSLGFTAMSRHVRNTGAFYAYVAKGLGKPAGIGAAMVTIFAYGMLCVSFYGYLGFFAALTAKDLFGIDLPWGLWAIAAAVIVAFLGYRQIDVGAKVLAVLLTAEVLILLILSVAVLVRSGGEGMSLAPFDPANVFFATGAGTLFVLGFGSYIGFEGTAIYSEEAKDPRRTVPRATYIAIGFLAIFYAFTFWILTVAFGIDGIMSLALGDDFAEMAFIATDQNLGLLAVKVMQVLIVTSFFACLIAFHNASSRYIFSMGRERLLPAALGATHPKSKAPHRASLVMTVISIVAVIGCVVLGADPYLGFGLWSYSSGVIGIVFAQAVTAVAVTAYFMRDRQGYGPFRVLIAPALGAIGLTIGVILIVTNFDVITGMTGAVNWVMIVPTPLLFVVGIVIGFVMKRRNPDHYARLAEQGSVR
ncbi:APC family permease [Saxibacter everestensis]|uniref:APC family permease n=1 Tax=Saxibacter everestensis TaxID=2909229 RepID=A0ABY8QVY4_9MICO|nr:APC family permease [Brevibacteriaceae bacterium ZFBP1038]